MTADVSAAFEAATARHRAGQLAEAERLYAEILAASPEHFGALHRLGILALQRGDAALAVRRIEAALRRQPGSPEAETNLGIALQRLGRPGAALAAFERARAADPGTAERHNNVGNALMALDRAEEAIACYREAIARGGLGAEPVGNLGAALKACGRVDEAIAACEAAIALEPGRAELHNNLGAALASRDRFAEALPHYDRAVSLDPRLAEAHNNRGAALAALERPEAAVPAFEAAVAARPGYAEALYNLGNALRGLERPDAAAGAYRRALAADPRLVAAYNNLANLLIDRHELGEAERLVAQGLAAVPDAARLWHARGYIAERAGRPWSARPSYERALALDAEHHDAAAALGRILIGVGRHAEGERLMRAAAAAQRDSFSLATLLLFWVHYGGLATPQEVFDLHRATAERVERESAPPAEPFDNPPVADRRLRIGYVSPDFRRHSCAYFAEPLLRSHDRGAVEIWCYSAHPIEDETTRRLQRLADHWRPIWGKSDKAVARQVRADRIDILVDLAGWTEGGRIGVFLQRPAPVAATWLGYPDTTGVRAIDYRITDAVADPPGEADRLATERLVRLPLFLCYAGDAAAPPPDPPPALAGGGVTFGSFNTSPKITDAVVDAWAEILRRVPAARLVVKSMTFAEPETRDLFLARFAARGIGRERVSALPPTGGLREHLASYGRIDVALDTFPYNGTTTTCEALWMGVPVVALRGDRHSGRVGATLLAAVGLADWVADDVAGYVARAVAAAADLSRLAALRAGLRRRMAESPLCDGGGFARSLEAAFRTMWRDWCAARSIGG